MPSKTKILTAPGYSAEDLQSLAYGAFSELNWAINYANDTILIVVKKERILIEAANGQLTISSKMIHDEMFDLTSRNKRNIEQFEAAFEKIKAKATEADLAGWKEKIIVLREESAKALEQELKDSEEIDRVMNFSKSNLYITYGIIAINIVVFILMVMDGVSILEPKTADIIRWGANYGPLNLSGDWWRLITSVFVHIGIIHIVFNMVALYMAGVYLEPMLGKVRYIVAYLCTGVCASLLSLWWHKEPVAAAGASGAIFGLYGLFLALLVTKAIPKQIRNGLLQSIGIFVAYNLIYGLKAGVDNAGHVGGLVSGFVVGCIYYLTLKKDGARKLLVPAVAAVILLTMVITVVYLENNKTGSLERKTILQEMQNYRYKDAERFENTFNRLVDIEEKALAPYNNNQLSDAELANQLEEITLPEWEKAEAIMRELESYDVSDQSKQKASLMNEYVQLRIVETRLRVTFIREDDEATGKELADVTARLNELVSELINL